MKKLLLVLTVICLLGIACDSSTKSALEPPFDTVFPSTDILVAAPKLVEEDSQELSPSEGTLWNEEAEAPLLHTRICEGRDVKIWMSAYVFSTELDAHAFFNNFSKRLGESADITEDHMPWLEHNDEAMRWYSYDFPCELYEDGSVGEGVIFRVERYVGHVQVEDLNPYIVPSAWAAPPIVPRGEGELMFWGAIDYTIVQIRSLT